MPNYCQNKTTFTHPDVAKLRELRDEFLKIQSGDGEKGSPLNYLRPIPADLLETVGWYNWRIANWGTKWDAMTAWGVELDEDEKTLTVSFHTAWSPPIDLYEYLHEETEWRVEAVYFEAGMGFCGGFDEENGHDQESDMPSWKYKLITAAFDCAI
jgi:hypothetical protein